MSFRLRDAVDYLGKPLTGNDKAVLGALCKHASNDGKDSWASVATIARETGLSESSIHRALRNLKKHRCIRAVTSGLGGRHSETTEYEILLPNADMLAAIRSLENRGTGVTQTPVDNESDDGCHTDTRTGATQTPHGCHTDTPTGVTQTPKSVLLNRSGKRSGGSGQAPSLPLSEKTEEQGKKPFEYSTEESEEIAAIFGKQKRA